MGLEITDEFLEETAQILKNWCEKKSKTESDFYFDEKHCIGKSYVKFRTAMIEKVLPPTDDKGGAWKNGHYIFYELSHRKKTKNIRIACVISLVGFNQNQDREYIKDVLIDKFYKGTLRKDKKRVFLEPSRLVYEYKETKDMNKIKQEITNSLDNIFGEYIKEFEKRLLTSIDEFFNDDRSNCIVSDPKSDGEGKKVQYYTTKYERSIENRKAAIKAHGTSCMACGFDFEKVYGDIGKDFIEVHHTKPLSSLQGETNIDVENDLVCVCSNCHSMIHRRKNKVLTIEELKNLIRKGTSCNK